MVTMKAVLIGAAALALTAPALAQQNPPPNPCETEPEFNEFDFWLGDWNVYQGDGTLAGVNRITKTDNGCLIRENWRSSTGSTGFSMNFFEVGSDSWRQVWVSQGAQIDYSGGLDEAGVMRLQGLINYPATGLSAPFRGAWTLRDDGTVLQEFQQQDPETGAWNIWFIGRYVPAGSEPDNEDAAAIWSDMP
jgi:hypothetical protein